MLVPPNKYEITVRYTQDEWTEFNPTHSEPDTISNTTDFRGEGSTISDYQTSTSTITSKAPTTRLKSQPKIVLYECREYRVENGVLIMLDEVGSMSGFMVPLSVIQEIRVDIVGNSRRTRPKMDQIN